MGGYQLVDEALKGYEEYEVPGFIATSEDWDNYYAHKKRRQRSQRGVPLTLDQFKVLLRNPDFKLPRITTSEIRDRSKGDESFRLLAVLQVTWFVLQLVARAQQRLALSEVELMTLVITTQSGITFAVWWQKPLDLKVPVNVYVSPGQIETEQNDDDDDARPLLVFNSAWHELTNALKFIFDPLRYNDYKDHNILLALGMYLVWLPYHFLFILTYPIFHLFPLGISFLLWIIKMDDVGNTQQSNRVAMKVVLAHRRLRYHLANNIRKYFGGILRQLPFAYEYSSFVINWFFIFPSSFFFLLIVLTPLFILSVASFICTGCFEVFQTNTVPSGAARVPTFYCPRTEIDRYPRMMAIAILGCILGGVQCVAWRFIFPTRAEQFVWRYTAIALVVVPVFVAVIDYILENVKLNGMRKMSLGLDILMTALLFFYVLARLSLIAQAFALMRDQPPTTYIAVDWTSFMPHLT